MMAFITACTVGEEIAPQCQQLAASLASCGADPSLATYCEQSDPEEIQATLESSCEQLQTGAKSDGFSLDGRTEGQWCVLSSQCVDGLVCRSALSFANQCLPPGQLGEHCWVSSHCADGLSCHWIAAHQIPGMPIHPGRVCNPHGADAHPHQLDGT